MFIIKGTFNANDSRIVVSYVRRVQDEHKLSWIEDVDHAQTFTNLVDASSIMGAAMQEPYLTSLELIPIGRQFPQWTSHQEMLRRRDPERKRLITEVKWAEDQVRVQQRLHDNHPIDTLTDPDALFLALETSNRARQKWFDYMTATYPEYLAGKELVYAADRA